MKQLTLCLLGAAVLFCSCNKDNPDNYASKDSETELRSIIAELQKEVASLKEEISDLKAQGGDQSVDLTGIESDLQSIKTDILDLQSNKYNGMFEVDGLWFSKSGFIMSQPKAYEFTTTEEYIPNQDYSYEITLDEYGRIKTSKYSWKRLGGGAMHYDNTTIETTNYEYSGKTIKTTITKTDGHIDNSYTTTSTQTIQTTYF